MNVTLQLQLPESFLITEGKADKMTRKVSLLPSGTAFPEWNSECKEPWHYDFEKEPVNDEKWSCIVTAAIPAEAKDEEYIQIYTQCVSTGLRKAVKVISMADVLKLLKENANVSINKKEMGKQEKHGRNSKFLHPRSLQIIELAAKYATFSDADCKLPSDLMADVLKCMILSLRSENCLQKRIDAVKERKMREQDIRAKFIRDLKPYKMSQEERKSSRKVPENIFELENPINDEPVVGPDLYIMLVDFYDAFIFPELLKINVPFLTFLKISGTKNFESKHETSTFLIKSDVFERKKFLINSFWGALKEDIEKMKFKDIATLHYTCFENEMELKSVFYRDIFDELTWMQYSAYRLYSQHQKYLQEVYVQRLILSLEPLDLTECEVYNKLCDALVTGESLTPLIVLYAIVEQVVAGVPETESAALEYEPKFIDLFPTKSESSVPTDEKDDSPKLITPCTKCRNKEYKNICDELKKSFSDNLLLQNGEWTESSDKSSVPPKFLLEGDSPQSSEKPSKAIYSELGIPESLINQVMREKKTEKEMRKEKNWKTPSICSYGDFVSQQTYFCDSRLLDSKSIIDRFLKKLELPQIWKKYPELRPEERAFYNYHFFTFWKNSEECEDKLKLKIFFTMSMKLVAITKSYLFRGEEENRSETASNVEKERINLGKNSSIIQGIEEERDFCSFFHNMFLIDINYQRRRKTIIRMKSVKESKDFMLKKSSQLPHKAISHFSMHSSNQSKSYPSFHPNKSKSTDNEIANIFSAENAPKSQESFKKIMKTLFSLMCSSEISNLSVLSFLGNKEEYFNLIQGYRFYEKLKPNLMVQRLTEARENFNTVICSYFPPADALIIVMHNDFDHRGVFYINKSGALQTPVGFRDFFAYVYPEIKNWLVDENTEYVKFLAETNEKVAEENEKKDVKYLTELRKQYCEMSKEKRKEFLESDVEIQTEPEISEKELGDLPIKPKPRNSDKVSFVITNFKDVRVEVNQKIHEFFSTDGTEINFIVETWLYEALKLQKLRVKRSNLELYYHQQLGTEETNSSFTLKTTSDLIFAFYKDDSEQLDDFNYHVTISWPTGLLIRPVPHGSSMYIKQSYLKTCRRGRDIEEERSRCFLRNGQVLIFKENGDYELLCGSGTKYIFKESALDSKYEIISTTGEIWEVRRKGPCKNKKKLIGTNKIFIGFDPKTQETFYKREDGMFFMLWQNGTLVINRPDGTKITSVPYFEEIEVTVEWTEEEKLYYEELETKYRSEISVREPRSRAILRNSSTPKSVEMKSFENEGFVPVLCSYVMEHPKYSTVYFDPNDPYIKMKMPEQLCILICPEGNYEVQQEENSLQVQGSTIQFYKYCHDCKDQSLVTIFTDSNELLCRCVDFSKKAFSVFRNGRIMFEENYMKPQEEKQNELKKKSEMSDNILGKCPNEHNKNPALMQRCFAVERDLNGMEFIHSDPFAFYCYHLPEETYFDFDTDDPLNSICTFSSPVYKIGYEKWAMDYENAANSLPTNLKKKDLKEMGVKEIQKKLFKYPFPRQSKDKQQNEKPKTIINMPKFIIGRTIRYLGEEPVSVINDLKNYVATYQKRAQDICKIYKNYRTEDDRRLDSKSVEMRLRKIAVALNQNQQMYPHLGTQLPSTEQDIHYFGHFINAMDGLKSHFQDQINILPDCKQIPQRLPKSSYFPSIYEENESSENT